MGSLTGVDWYPRWHVDQALAVTAGWYRQTSEGAPPANMTRAQINDYFASQP